MPRSWDVIATAKSKEGTLELRRRFGSEAYIIAIGGRVIMSSESNRSEKALGSLAAAAIPKKPHARILVGGLGMAYTLRTLLDGIGFDAQVIVVELLKPVIEWCRGPLAPLNGNALADPRVTVVEGDVSRQIMRHQGLDAIVLDLWEGPHGDRGDPMWGDAALHVMHAALAPGGVLAVWSEDPAPGFAARLEAFSFTVRKERIEGGGPRHRIYLARTAAASKPASARTERSRR